MSNSNIVESLIQNIKEDQKLLEQADKEIEIAKDSKRVIGDRLKDYRKDILVLQKYANEKQLAKIEELGLDLSESSRSMNSVATTVLDIIMKAKDNKLTNAELYDEYVASLKNKDEAVNYTEFNIKCRSLFNTQRLLRKKGNDPKSSRTDIISLNGRVPESKEKKK